MSTFLQIVAWSTFVFWQPVYFQARQWYEKRKQQVIGAPPGWVFGVVWSILYALIVAVAVLTFGNSTDNVEIFVLFLFNLVLNKMWSPVFFNAKRFALAALIIVGMILTSIAILVLLGIKAFWLPFGLYIPYVLWTCYALFLNIQFILL